MKLFVFDVDGTLVIPPKYILRKRTIEEMNKRLQNGDAIAIASGRGYDGCKQYLDKLCSGKKFVIAVNGAVTYDEFGRIIDSHTLKFQDYLDAYKKGEWLESSKKAAIYCFTDKEICFYKLRHTIVTEGICNKMALRNLNKNPLKPTDDIYKFMYSCPREDFNLVDTSYEKEKFHFVSSDYRYHEFVNKETDKAVGVEALRKYLNLKVDDVYTFGDQLNDYEMIKNYHGVAMGNATEKVKEVAKLETRSVRDLGVAYALKKLIEK